MSEGRRRLATVVAVAAALVVGLVVDAQVGRPRPAPAGRGPVTVTGLPRADAESTAFYCAGGGPGAGVPATVLLSNPTTRPVHGTVTAVGTSGPSRSVPVTVPAEAVASVASQDLTTAAWAAVSVTLDGGGVAVSQSVASATGWSAAPCAATAAADWYFAHGSTAGGTSTVLSLYNPSATTADVDVDLVTSGSGYLEPPAYQELSVPAGSLVTENLADHDPDDPAVATEVEALAGTVVADELEVSPAAGHQGLALSLGAPAPAARWCFAQTTDVGGGSEQFSVLNPTTRTVSVRVGFTVPDAAVSPLTVSVGPQATATVSAGSQTRLPGDVAYTTCLVAAGGGVVVSRQVAAPAAAPSPQTGEAPGSPEAAADWLVSPVPTPGTGLWSLAVADAGPRPVRVTVWSVADGRRTLVAGADRRAVSPSAPLLLGPGDPPPPTMLVVSATGPVDVEADAVPAGSPGVVVVPAFVAGTTP